MVVRPMTARDSRDVACLSDQLGYPSSASDIEKRLGAMNQGTHFGAFVAVATDGGIACWIHVFGVRFLQEDGFAEISGQFLARSRPTLSNIETTVGERHGLIPPSLLCDLNDY